MKIKSGHINNWLYTSDQTFQEAPLANCQVNKPKLLLRAIYTMSREKKSCFSLHLYSFWKDSEKGPDVEKQ